jgi:hypothetical protein
MLLIDSRAMGEAQSHAAETNRRDFEAALSKLSFLHITSPSNG